MKYTSGPLGAHQLLAHARAERWKGAHGEARGPSGTGPADRLPSSGFSASEVLQKVAIRFLSESEIPTPIAASSRTIRYGPYLPAYVSSIKDRFDRLKIVNSFRLSQTKPRSDVAHDGDQRPACATLTNIFSKHAEHLSWLTSKQGRSNLYQKPGRVELCTCDGGFRMAGLALTFLSTSAILVAVWLAGVLYRFVKNFYRIQSALQAQFPSPPGAFFAGHATPAAFGSSKAFLSMTDLLMKHGKTIATRLVHKPVGDDQTKIARLGWDADIRFESQLQYMRCSVLLCACIRQMIATPLRSAGRPHL
jgi:hypothetical protein